MDFLFRSKTRTKTPAELVANCRQSIAKLDNAQQRKLATEDLTKCLQLMKALYLGDADNEPNPDATTQLAQQIYHADILPLLVTNMPRLEFEAKKDVVAIFNGLLRRQIADRLTTVEYLVTREATIVTLSRSYMLPGTALQCGQMLRECLRHEQLATVLLTPSGASTPNTNSPSSTRQCEIWNYFDYIENSTFDIASDAFSTFRMILTLHKHLAAEFLQSNYDRFFEAYTKLLTSSNYVWKRQSLKLLGEILLDRVNYNVMSVYIKSTDNLKLMMNLLRDRSAHIQFEAFHVFKVFVANPNKEDGVRRILRTNKEKLVVYLSDFHNDRKDDEQFSDEKRFLIDQISEL